MKKLAIVCLLVIVLAVITTGCAVSNRAIKYADNDADNDKENNKPIVENKDNKEILFLGPYQAYRTAEMSKYLNRVYEDERRREREDARHDKMLELINNKKSESKELISDSFQTVFINDTQTSKTFLVKECDTQLLRSWQFKLSSNDFTVKLFETGFYAIWVFREGDENPVWSGIMCVHPEPVTDYNGYKYYGRCTIRGE